MIKTTTDYQSLTLSMIRVPKFQQAVEDSIHILYKNEPTKRKNMFQGNFFQEGGLDFFQTLGGGLTKKWGGGGVINIHFQGRIALCRGVKFFQGGLRGVLPTMNFVLTSLKYKDSLEKKICSGIIYCYTCSYSKVLIKTRGKPSTAFTPTGLNTWISPVLQENTLKILSSLQYLTISSYSLIGQ